MGAAGQQGNPGCREEGRGWWRRGGGTYRQPLHSEARLGSTTGLIGKQAAPAHVIPAGQCHRSQRSIGSQAGIIMQLKATRPPPEAVCRATLSSQSPPRPPEPSYPVCSRWSEPFGPPHHDKVTGPGFPWAWRELGGREMEGGEGITIGGGGRVWDPKVCVSKVARQSFPCCKFRFFSTLVWRGGVRGGGGGKPPPPVADSRSNTSLGTETAFSWPVTSCLAGARAARSVHRRYAVSRGHAQR